VPEIDLVMGPQYANRISDLLEDVINGNQVRIRVIGLFVGISRALSQG